MVTPYVRHQIPSVVGKKIKIEWWDFGSRTEGGSNFITQVFWKLCDGSLVITKNSKPLLKTVLINLNKILIQEIRDLKMQKIQMINILTWLLIKLVTNMLWQLKEVNIKIEKLVNLSTVLWLIEFNFWKIQGEDFTAWYVLQKVSLISGQLGLDFNGSIVEECITIENFVK